MNLKVTIDNPFPIPMTKKECVRDFFKELKQELVIRLKASSVENRLKNVYLVDDDFNVVFWGKSLEELLNDIEKEMAK